MDRRLQEDKVYTIISWCFFLESLPLGATGLTKWTKPHSPALQGAYSLVHTCKHSELKKNYTHTVVILSNISVKESIIEHTEAQIK